MPSSAGSRRRAIAWQARMPDAPPGALPLPPGLVPPDPDHAWAVPMYPPPPVFPQPLPPPYPGLPPGHGGQHYPPHPGWSPPAFPQFAPHPAPYPPPHMPPSPPGPARQAIWTPRRVAISNIEARLLLAAVPMHNKAKEQLIAALSRFYRSEHPIRATVTVQQWKKGPVVFQLRPLTASSAYCYFTRVRSGGNEDPTITPGGVANPPSASGEGRAGAAPWLGLMSAAAMGTDELLDHLIVSAMECGLESGAAGRPGKPAVLGLPEVQSALSEPVRGVRLSESTLNFGVVETGASERLSLLVINSSVDGFARLRAVRVLGADAAFRLAEPRPPLAEGGALLPPGGRVEVHISFDAAEVGLYRSWLFLLVDVLSSTHRTFTSSAALFGCVLGGAALPVRDGSRFLSVEARPFIPESLRAIWQTPTPASLFGGPLALPPPPFRQYTSVHTLPSHTLNAPLAPAWKQMAVELSLAMEELLPRAVRGGRAPHTLAGRPTSELCGFSPASWERSTAVWDPALASKLAVNEESNNERVWRNGPGVYTLPGVLTGPLRQAGITETRPPLGYAGPPAAVVWELLHLKRLGLLLHLEELKMAEDYIKMDSFSTQVSRNRPATLDDGSPILRASIVGLEERHPPALVGDALLLRLASLPGLEVPCRIIGIERRTQLLFVPAWQNDRLSLRQLLTQAVPALWLEGLIRQLAPFADTATVDGARRDMELLFCPLPVPPPVPPPAQGHALVHIRFLLNRSVFQHMHFNLQMAIERMEVRMPEAGLPFGISLLPVDLAPEVDTAGGEGGDRVEQARAGVTTGRAESTVGGGERVVEAQMPEQEREEAPVAQGERVGEVEARGPGVEALVAGGDTLAAGGAEAATSNREGGTGGAVHPGRGESPVVAAAAAVEAACAAASPDSGLGAAMSNPNGAAPPTPSARKSELTPFTSNINPEQLSAVAAMCGPREAMRGRYERMPPYVVFGPPGTGKTVVVVELVLQLLASHPDPRLLVCAPSNSAADVLLARLHSRMDELRGRLDANLPTGSEDGAQRLHADQPTASQDGARGLDRLVYRLHSQTRNVEDMRTELLRYCSVDAAVNQFLIPSSQSLMAERAILCTCAATRMLLEVGMPCSASPRPSSTPAGLQELVDADTQRLHFTHVLIDEASQALEPEMLLPLAFAGPGCDVLICGDHKQLGPTVRSSFCRENGLAISMLERLIQLPTYRDAPAVVGRRRLVEGGEGPAAEGREARFGGREGPAVEGRDGPVESIAALNKFSRQAPTGEDGDASAVEGREPRSGGDTAPAEGGGGSLAVEGSQAPKNGWREAPNESSGQAPNEGGGGTRQGGAADARAEVSDQTLRSNGARAHAEEPERGAASLPSQNRLPCVTRLVRNYRSHRSLLSLPSRLFYGETLRECADAKQTGSLEQWGELRRQGFPLLFYGVRSAHTHELDSPSFFNPLEAEKVAELIGKLLSSSKADGGKITTNDVAVVTPFRKQVLKVRQLLRSMQLGAVRVGSVDDYQGQEENIIIISTVMASGGDRPNIGHLSSPHGLMSSPQRFNVAITRAKALLVVVGDPNALIDDPSWRELLRYAVDNGAYKGCPHPLLMEGAEDDEHDDTLAELADRMAQTVLGAGNAMSMFPSLTDAMYQGAYDEADDQPWRVML